MSLAATPRRRPRTMREVCEKQRDELQTLTAGAVEPSDAIVRAQAATDKREILKQKFVLYARDGTAAALRPLA